MGAHGDEQVGGESGKLAGSRDAAVPTATLGVGRP